MSAIVGVIIGLVLAYSLSSIVVSQVNELIRTFLRSRTTFLVKHLNRMFSGIFSATSLDDYVANVLRHPLINAVSDDKEPVRQTTSIDPAHLTKVIEQTLNDPNLPPEFQKLLVNLTGNLAANPTVQDIQFAIEQAKQNMELVRNWVDKQFDQMTKIYKRNIFISTFLLGLLISVVLNIDTIQMTQFLWKDPTMRQAVVETAGQVAAQSAQNANTNFTAQSEDGTETEAPPTEEQIQTAVEGSSTAVNNLLEANLPIMWISGEDAATNTVFPEGRDPRVLEHVRNNPDMILWKIIGILFSAAAISLGSDFWFNALRNLAGRR